MAQIKTSTNYHYKGLNFTKLSQVKEAVENQIGRIIDEIGKKDNTARLHYKQRLPLLELLTNKETREELKKLLSVEMEYHNEETTEDYTKNIFDIEEL